HMHIMPIYKATGHEWQGDSFHWLPTRMKSNEPGKREELPPTPQEYQESKEKLEDSNGLVGERSKAVAELASEKDSLIQGHTIIKPKKSISSDIQQVDEQT